MKLTEENFDYIHWEKDDAGPEQFQLTIHGNSEEQCKTIKHQILQKQEIVDRVKSRLDMAKTLKDDYMIQLFTEILGESKQ